MPADCPDLAELMAADARGEVSDDVLDDELWTVMIQRGGPLDDPANASGPVRHYGASRLMEWEVGNGGFAQAAYNIPQWFEAAAEGYEAIGLVEAAARIRAAAALVDGGQVPTRFNDRPDATIESVFSAFAESELARFDEGLDAIGWWATAPRLAYVRAHRSAFAAFSVPRREG